MNSPIQFSIGNRYYNLDFKFPDINLIQLVGNSGTGKTLMCHDFKRMQGVDKNLDNSIVINPDINIDIMTILSAREYNIVIIDEAEKVITEEAEEYIWNCVVASKPTRRVIISRKLLDCAPTFLVRGELKHSIRSGKDYITVGYAKTVGGNAKC